MATLFLGLRLAQHSALLQTLINKHAKQIDTSVKRIKRMRY